MPFTKIGPDKYRSPSGKEWTGAQVKMYYATNGFTKKPKKKKHDHGRKSKVRG